MDCCGARKKRHVKEDLRASGLSGWVGGWAVNPTVSHPSEDVQVSFESKVWGSNGPEVWIWELST